MIAYEAYFVHYVVERAQGYPPTQDWGVEKRLEIWIARYPVEHNAHDMVKCPCVYIRGPSYDA
jgi:hypothetical protein